VEAAALPGTGLQRKGRVDPKRDQDLRDACVTLLYRAACHLQQIADITGHTYASVKTIVENDLVERAPRNAVQIKHVGPPGNTKRRWGFDGFTPWDCGGSVLASEEPEDDERRDRLQNPISVLEMAGDPVTGRFDQAPGTESIVLAGDVQPIEHNLLYAVKLRWYFLRPCRGNPASLGAPSLSQ
jgi:hypothetical protein